MRRAVERHWPALLVTAACAGIGLSIWVTASLEAVCALVAPALAGVVVLRGQARIAALGFAVAVLGLGWGSIRMEAMRQSVLEAELGESGTARLVTLASARPSPWAIRVVAAVQEFRQRPVRERVLLVLPVGRSPPRGTVLEASVRVSEARPSRAGFDERQWLARQGIHVVLEASSWRPVGRRGGIAGLADRLRDRIELAIGRGTVGVRRGIVLGVVLGEDEGLPGHVQDDFRASGLYHLLAVSGQNVAFLAAGIYGLGWLLRLSRAWRELLVVGGVVAYVLAVGWQPSVVRAGVAGALASLAWLTARPRDRWHLLAVGAFVLMAWMPTSLLEPGFQLSFTAVAAIFVSVPRITSALEGYPLPPGASDALAVALACGVATAPIVLLHFGQFPAYTVLANVVAFVAAPVVLALGLLAAVVDPVSPDAAAGLAALAGWAAAWLELVARVVADFPSAQIGTRTVLLTCALGLVGWLAVRQARRRLRVGMPVALVVGGVAIATAAAWLAARPAPAWNQPAGLRVTFLDVGQGDSALIETPRARVLVDEGPPEADVAGQLVGMGVRSLSALVLTHPQRDHVGGAARVIRRLRVAQVLDPGQEATGPEYEEAIAAARARGVPVRIVRAGETFRLGRLVLRVLWPADAGGATEDPNLNAVVITASFGETDVFLPADAESDVTAKLPLTEVEIVKVAHHGSEDPGLSHELEDLRPRIAVISCGRGNEYGHPRPETLAALDAFPGLAVYRTDEDGRVVVESDGRGLSVKTAR